MNTHKTMTAVVSRLAGREVVSVRSLRRGRNSLVSAVLVTDGIKYAVKEYFDPRSDGQHRLETEFAALRWLVQNGETRVPRPIACDVAAGIGMYEFVEGAEVIAGPIVQNDIDQAADFLLSLNRLRSVSGADELPRAAESCFTLDEIMEGIRRRVDVLLRLEDVSVAHADMKQFLASSFLPRFEAACDASAHTARVKRWLKVQIPKGERVLSPSDFGFHNAIRRPDGTLAFVDFEYFGWDDCAKMIVDFLLHPAMHLTPELGARFCRRMGPVLPKRQELAARLPAAYTFFGLKWCLILLNEYVAGHRARRRFAGDTSADEHLLNEQLAKAKAMLEKVRCGFPQL